MQGVKPETDMERNGRAVSLKLFADEARSVYAVLDGASIPGLVAKLHQYQPDYFCLYRGELPPDMAEVAPYLVHLQINTDFTAWVTGEGWGKHWGIFALSSADLRSLRQHFRGFLTVYDPNTRPMLFRYYDPRVLRTYLPTCNKEELEAIFGPVHSFLMEDEAGEGLLRFQFTSGALKSEKV
jgi:hypothetical protein